MDKRKMWKVYVPGKGEWHMLKTPRPGWKIILVCGIALMLGVAVGVILGLTICIA